MPQLKPALPAKTTDAAASKNPNVEIIASETGFDLIFKFSDRGAASLTRAGEILNQILNEKKAFEVTNLESLSFLGTH